ncbi:MAG: sulfite exporter TauE/SafE family protein [Steroidobacterales bacterium]
MLNDLPSIGLYEWAAAILGAMFVGMAKAGIAGINGLFVGLFALVLPSVKQASGVVLPLIIVGDWIAVTVYRRHLKWRHLGRLFPWAAAGVVLGYFAMGHFSDRTIKVLVGSIIVTLSVLSYWRRFRSPPPPAGTEDGPGVDRIHWFLGACMGVLAGFATLVANAAGPLMAIYLVAMRLPKMEYVGTTAIFFALLNLFKLPFMVRLGLVSLPSLAFDALLVPAVVIGLMGGRWLLARMNQRLFEELALALSAITGIALLA